MLSCRREWLNEQGKGMTVLQVGIAHPPPAVVSLFLRLLQANPALLNERMNGVASRAVQKVQALRENRVS